MGGVAVLHHGVPPDLPSTSMQQVGFALMGSKPLYMGQLWPKNVMVTTSACFSTRQHTSEAAGNRLEKTGVK